MIRTHYAGLRSAAGDTPAARALKAKLAAKRGAKSKTETKLAPVATAAKPEVKWSAEIAASPPARAMTERAVAVMGSPNFEQHRDLAITLLKNPRLSGADIICCLAIAGANSEAEAHAALADMKAALADAQQQYGAAATPAQSNSSAAMWGRVIAKVNEEIGQ